MEIRLASVDDAPSVLGIYAPFCETFISFEERPPTQDEMRARMEKILKRLPWLVAATDGVVAGYAYACPHRERAGYRWSVESAIYIDERFRHAGVGRALYTSLFRCLTVLGYYNAYAGVTQPNPASMAFHQAMGFEPVGVYRNVGYKCGAWRDVAWWQKALKPHPREPEPPRQLEQVFELPEWRSALAAGLAFRRASVPSG